MTVGDIAMLLALIMPINALKRSHTVTLLSALASVTERIGLIATASTTYYLFLIGAFAQRLVEKRLDF